MTKKYKFALISTLFGLSLLNIGHSFAQTALQADIKSIAKQVTGNVGVYAEVLETEETVSYNGNNRFPMQSVYKFPIAMAVLHSIDEGKLKLNQKVLIHKKNYISSNGHSPIRDHFPNGTDMTIRELLRYSVSESDGSASDILSNILGGIEIADQYLKKIGAKNIRIATTEKVQVVDELIQYKNWTTPKAMTNLLKLFYTGNHLTPNSRMVLLTDMTESPTGPSRLKGLLPKGTSVAHKTGTSGTTKNGLTRATNDVGIITLPNGKHLAISVFISDSYSSEIQREATIAKIAKAAFDFYIH